MLQRTVLKGGLAGQAGIFTSLHGMQTQSSDENSVCLSVCQTRGL